MNRYGQPPRIPSTLGNRPMPDFQQYRLRTEFYESLVVHNQSQPSQEIWTVVGKLGEGAQGAVNLETCDTPRLRLRAVKKISQEYMKAHNINIRREMGSLIAVRDHPEHFVRFFGWYEDSASQYIYLAMEYLQHGDLQEYLRNNRDEAKQQAQRISKQLVEGLAVLHNKNICHRDLKPQNVLIACVAPIQVKLADFGISKSTIGTDLRTMIGTASYMAPELLGVLPPKLRSREGYTSAVDIWALGCLIYEMLTLETPFLDTSSSDLSGLATTTTSGPRPLDTYLLMEYCKGEVTFPTDTLVSASSCLKAIDFVKRLLAADPGSRLSAADAINHSWLSGTVPERLRPSASQLFTWSRPPSRAPAPPPPPAPAPSAPPHASNYVSWYHTHSDSNQQPPPGYIGPPLPYPMYYGFATPDPPLRPTANRP